MIMAVTFGWRPFCYPRIRITSGELLPKSMIHNTGDAN